MNKQLALKSHAQLSQSIRPLLGLFDMSAAPLGHLILEQLITHVTAQFFGTINVIYRCENCGREIVADDRDPLTSQNRHQHTYDKGPIQWRLVASHSKYR